MLRFLRTRRRRLLPVVAAGVLGAGALAAVVLPASSIAQGGGEDKRRSAGKVRPKVPVTPSVDSLGGSKRGNVRTYQVTASQFTQRIANFPIQTGAVLGL